MPNMESRFNQLKLGIDLSYTLLRREPRNVAKEDLVRHLDLGVGSELASSSGWTIHGSCTQPAFRTTACMWTSNVVSVRRF